jgi:hypothetical protein
MHLTQPKKDKNTVTGKLGKVGTGHTPHRGGGGAHRHKCDRRQGNRSQQQKRVIGEW